MDNIVKYGCLNPSEDEDDDMPEADGPADDEPLTANSFIVRKAPPTIRYIPNFITESEADYLLAQIYEAPKPKWQQLVNRRLQNWGGIVGMKTLIPDGDIPPWLTAVIDKIMSLDDTFPLENKPNHVLINEYLPGQGIMGNISKEERYIGSMLLQPCSLLLVSDRAYTNCLHEIADRPFDVITDDIFNIRDDSTRIGEIVNRGRRVSLTIRNVPKVYKMTAADLVAKR